jgi:hypothetical protein
LKSAIIAAYSVTTAAARVRSDTSDHLSTVMRALSRASMSVLQAFSGKRCGWPGQDP